MKSFTPSSLFILGAFLIVTQVHAEKEIIIRHFAGKPSEPLMQSAAPAGPKKEKITYLGVETAPVDRALGTQLGLSRGMGLVVTRLMEQSPAAKLLREDDVLIKFDDQLLVNIEQLSVLVRARAEGAEISLTIMRGGKEQSFKAKLSAREVEIMPPHHPRIPVPFGSDHLNGGGAFFHKKLGDNHNREDQLELEATGLPPREIIIQQLQEATASGSNGQIIARIRRGEHQPERAESRIYCTDDQGSLELTVEHGQRRLAAKNPQGVEIFQGPINTEAERKQLPAGLLQRLEKIENETVDINVDAEVRGATQPRVLKPAKL
ncbi:MAG: PDZ domain-containing protein [Opitutaceae bacterium]|nr:PDZ domain-containing protein [Opitutaceae bacterium]NBR59464.1 PDZ domain-containing protein [Opitutaceae bacterium]